MPVPKLIIFDCDGVLVNSEEIYQAAELEFLASAGLFFEPVAYAQEFMGLSPTTWRKRLEFGGFGERQTSIGGVLRTDVGSYRQRPGRALGSPPRRAGNYQKVAVASVCGLKYAICATSLET